jgi:hypothetical protein
MMVREDTPSSGPDGRATGGSKDLNERTSGAVIARLLSDHSASTAEVHRANPRPMDLKLARLGAAALYLTIPAAQCLGSCEPGRNLAFWPTLDHHR